MLPMDINSMRRYKSSEYIAETVPSLCRVLAVTSVLRCRGGDAAPQSQVDKTAGSVEQETRRNAQSPQSLNDRLVGLRTTERIYRALWHSNTAYRHLQNIWVSTRLGVSTVTGIAASDGEDSRLEKMPPTWWHCVA